MYGEKGQDKERQSNSNIASCIVVPDSSRRPDPFKISTPRSAVTSSLPPLTQLLLPFSFKTIYYIFPSLSLSSSPPSLSPSPVTITCRSLSSRSTPSSIHTIITTRIYLIVAGCLSFTFISSPVFSLCRSSLPLVCAPSSYCPLPCPFAAVFRPRWYIDTLHLRPPLSRISQWAFRPSFAYSLAEYRNIVPCHLKPFSCRFVSGHT